MVGMENLIARWHGGHDMADDDRVEPPPIATLEKHQLTIGAAGDLMPRGESEAERDARIFGEAAVRTDQLRRKIESMAQELEAERQAHAETRKELEASNKQCGLYELEVAQQLNTIAALQAAVTEFRGSMGEMKTIFERHGIEACKKKNGRKNND